MSAVQSMSLGEVEEAAGAQVGLGAAGDDGAGQGHHHRQRDGGEEPAGQRRVAGGAFDRGQGDRVDARAARRDGRSRLGAGRSRRRSGSPRRRSSRTGRRRRRSPRSAARSRPRVAPRTRWVASERRCGGRGTSRAGRRAAIAAAVAISAGVLPPLGWGRTSERATRPAPARSRAPTARASERPGCSAPPAFSVARPMPG